MEVSRGCPYHCTFCAKDNFRDDYRKRPLPVILQEIDGLVSQGVEYVYFIDEILLPARDLLEALVERRVKHRSLDAADAGTARARRVRVNRGRRRDPHGRRAKPARQR